MLRFASPVVVALLLAGPTSAQQLLDLSELPPLDFEEAEAGADAEAGAGSDAAEPFPAPSLREPFAIGEALYDPGRVELAVVSLLDLLGVPIVADHATADAARVPTLAEEEVRLLVAMGIEDAEAAADRDESQFPFSLADLHAVLAPHLPKLDRRLLVEAYEEAYASRPDSPVAQVLMGQPIGLDTSLSRVHVWMLLVDGLVGFRGPAAVAGGPEVAVLRSRGGPSPGTAIALGLAPQRASAMRRVDLAEFRRMMAEWRRQEPDWFWLVEHEMLIASRIPIVVTPSQPTAHEGHGGPGRTVTLTASLGASPPAIRAPSGRPVLVPRAAADRRPVPMSWKIDSRSLSRLQAHGTLNGPVNSPAAVAAGGSLTLDYVPDRERANGQGTLNRDAATVRASVNLHDLIDTVYAFGPGINRASLLEARVERRVPIRIDWHAFGLRLKLVSNYEVGLDFGARTFTRRSGREGISGLLEEQADGSYRGEVRGQSLSIGYTESPWIQCPLGRSKGRQRLEVMARPVAGLNRFQSASLIAVSQGAMNGGYLALTFEPVTDPEFSENDSCQDGEDLLRPGSSGFVRFLPFNDSRWWTPEVPFVIAIPREGTLVYTDESLAEVDPGQVAHLGELREFITGTYTRLEVEVEREEAP